MPTEDQLPSQDEVDAVLNEVVEPEEIRVLKTDEERELAHRIIPFLVAKTAKQMEAKRAKALSETVEMLKSDNAKLIEAELVKIRDGAKPPDLKQIEQLLNQEYIEIKFATPDGKEFVVRELPQAAENRFLKIIQKRLVPRLSELASIEWTNTATAAE